MNPGVALLTQAHSSFGSRHMEGDGDEPWRRPTFRIWNPPESLPGVAGENKGV